MKKALRKNWIPKIVSLLLAIAIWFLIRDYLVKQGEYYDSSSEGRDQGQHQDQGHAPRAIPVPEDKR
jgi:hypothetical protein